MSSYLTDKPLQLTDISLVEKRSVPGHHRPTLDVLTTLWWLIKETSDENKVPTDNLLLCTRQKPRDDSRPWWGLSQVSEEYTDIQGVFPGLQVQSTLISVQRSSRQQIDGLFGWWRNFQWRDPPVSGLLTGMHCGRNGLNGVQSYPSVQSYPGLR